jgi:hypothetical protein
VAPGASDDDHAHQARTRDAIPLGDEGLERDRLGLAIEVGRDALPRHGRVLSDFRGRRPAVALLPPRSLRRDRQVGQRRVGAHRANDAHPLRDLPQDRGVGVAQIDRELDGAPIDLGPAHDDLEHLPRQLRLLPVVGAGVPLGAVEPEEQRQRPHPRRERHVDQHREHDPAVAEAEHLVLSCRANGIDVGTEAEYLRALLGAERVVDDEVQHARCQSAPQALEQPEPEPIGIPGAAREEPMVARPVSSPRYVRGHERLGHAVHRPLGQDPACREDEELLESRAIEREPERRQDRQQCGKSMVGHGLVLLVVGRTVTMEHRAVLSTDPDLRDSSTELRNPSQMTVMLRTIPVVNAVLPHT